MYVIRLDGQEIFFPALLNDPEQQLLSISLQLEIDTAGSLSFIVPPGHAAHDSIHKLKSTVTMEWDGVEIFRGRVLEEKTDAYNQKEVYCEGDLSFLLDSVQRPFTFEGSARAYIEQAIAEHNAQVEEYKRFTLGNFSALADETTLNLEGDGYTDTLSAIRAVLESHEGYLFTRYENGVRYLDFLTASGENTGQAIEFGVNLVDLENQTAAEDFCTVLLPIGGMLEDGTTVTIESVNDGLDYIEDAEAIAQYGRIVKTYAFDDVTDPAELLKLAQDKLNNTALSETLILQAVDMHIINPEKGIILPGKPVLIHTTPHGFDNQRKVCTALDLDPENVEKTTYTFGKPAKTQSGTAALIANKVEKHTRTVQQLYKHYTETDYTVKIHTGLLDSHDKYISEAYVAIDGINAQLLLKADQTTVTEQGQRLSAAEVAIDGANAAINLKASQTTVDALGERVSAAEVAIDGANAAINLKASQTTVDALGERVSAAEIAIDGANSEIALKADKIELEGLVRATDLEVVRADITNLTSGVTTASTLKANVLNADTSLIVGGEIVGKRQITMGDVGTVGKALSTDSLDLQHSHKVTVNDDGTITLGEVSAEGGNFKIADTKAYKDGVSAAYGNGYNEGFASGKESYLPTVISRTSYSTADKTVTVRAANSHQDLLTGQVIDASEIYNAGDSAGYSRGYSAGNGAGYNTGYAAGKDAYSPTTITRTGYSVANKTVTVKASNSHQDLLTGKTIDASEIYTAGYNAGFAAAESQFTAGTYYKGNGSTVYARGTSVTPTQRTLYVAPTSSATAVTVYDVGSSSTLYKGNGGSYVSRGDAITAYIKAG